MKILVIEDSASLRSSLSRGLRRLGHAVDAAADGDEGLAHLGGNDYDVVVLDLMLPGVDGWTVLRRLRASGKSTHVLILSAKDQVADRVGGLKLGADDYLVKPFSFDELSARVHALGRRRYERKSPTVRIGKVSINTSSRQAERDGELVPLTPKEYAVLECLLLNRGRVLSRLQILEAIYDSETYTNTNVVDVLICDLRRKLQVEADPPIVLTRRGAGYYIPE